MKGLKHLFSYRVVLKNTQRVYKLKCHHLTLDLESVLDQIQLTARQSVSVETIVKVNQWSPTGTGSHLK